MSAERIDTGEPCPVNLDSVSTLDLIKALRQSEEAARVISMELEDRAAFVIAQAFGIEDVRSVRLALSDIQPQGKISFVIDCSSLGVQVNINGLCQKLLYRDSPITEIGIIDDHNILVMFNLANLGPAKATDVATSPRTPVEQLTLEFARDATVAAHGTVIAGILAAQTFKKPD